MSKRILERNLLNRKRFYEVLDLENYTHEDLDQLSTKLREWSDISHNIHNSKFACPNGCRYCYIKTYGKELKISKTLVIDKKKVKRDFSRHEKGKVVMFASAHDIFENCVREYVSSAMKILEADLEVLVVSKPRMKVVEVLCKEFENFKDRVEFRFTICTDKPELRKIWETWAPTIEERVKCLEYCFERGFQTSVSMEPMLSDPSEMISKLDPFVTNSFWLGFMNHVEKLDIEDIHKRNVLKLKDREFVYELIHKLRKNEKVFWKESVVKFVKEDKRRFLDEKE